MGPGISDPQLRNYDAAATKGNLTVALTIASREAHLNEERDDRRQAGFWLRKVANALLLQGRYAEGRIAAEQSAEIQIDPHERARSLCILAANELFACKYNKALLTLGQVEELARAFRDDVYLHGILYGTRAFALSLLGDADQAFIDLKNAINQMLKGGYLSGAALQLNNAGFLLASRGQLKEAGQYLLYALELISKSPYLPHAAGIHDSIGYTYTLMGRYNNAERHLNESAEIFKRIANKAQLVGTWLHLSELHERMGNGEIARQEAERALNLATEVGIEHLRNAARNRLSSIEQCPLNTHRPGAFHDLIYASQQMASVIARLKVIAGINEVVLIHGETGTGKELAARAIHHESPRRAFPFVAFNCAALSRELVESRLFGYRKGAFTGADCDHAGMIRAAAGGTFLLDEIGDLPLEAQGALLRFLQSGEIQPVGARQPELADVRVIAATNCDLRQAVEAGRFRKDLYYRLNALSLYLPPLWSRREDVPVLARHFARVYSKSYGLPEPAITLKEMARLVEYEWPGNVRELENHIKHRVLFGEAALNPQIATSNGHAQTWRSLSESEKHHRLLEALESNSGNVTAAARQLGISRRTLQKFRHKRQREEA